MAQVKQEKKSAVFALFHDIESLDRGVGALTAAGFPSESISALLPDRASTHAFAHEKHTKAPEGAVAGGRRARSPAERSACWSASVRSRSPASDR